MLLLIGSIVLIRSYALYEEEKEFNVLKGQIPDFGYDIKMLSVVVDGEKSKTIPSRGMYKTQIDCSNGTRGEWDYNAWNLTLENVSENARCNITFTSNLSEEEYNKYIEAGKALRRNTYRGKDITSYHNDGSLYEMISSGRFDDIYVGDYINANNVTWLVADIDNYLYSGYKEGASDEGLLNKHHLTIIPASYLTTAAMNSTNATASSSAGAGLQGSSNNWEWYESQIDLMSEANVYGMNVFSSSGYDIGLDNHQYAIFQLKPVLIHSNGKGERFSYWLKNVASSEHFEYSYSYGVSHDGAASFSGGGVRPRFLIG